MILASKIVQSRLGSLLSRKSPIETKIVIAREFEQVQVEWHLLSIVSIVGRIAYLNFCCVSSCTSTVTFYISYKVSYMRMKVRKQYIEVDKSAAVKQFLPCGTTLLL